MKKLGAHARKVTIRIPADLFAWGEQERAKQGIARSELVARLYRRGIEEAMEAERLNRYGAAYARQPQTDEERAWAESSALTVALV